MILIFGGTTEGKIVAELFDIIGQPYFYSTRTDTHKQIKGTRVFGELDGQKMKVFCQENNIRLIIDAAHPFAVYLHENIYTTASDLGIETIRYERNFPDVRSSKSVRFFDSYDSMSDALLQEKFDHILALTGVQTITKLKSLWEQRTCYFRILDTDLSLRKSKETDLAQEFIIPMDPKANTEQLEALARKVNAEILLTKESGESGFFQSKLTVAEKLGIPLWVVERPTLPNYNHVADSPKKFLQLFYRVKTSSLKVEGQLRGGFTTGTCLTAATKACFIALVEKEFPKWVEVELPGGEKTKYVVFPEKISDKSSSCVVIKDAGDDPDATHAKEIGCELTFSETPGVHFLKGKGVGIITIPGFQTPVGEPAINPVPRKMVSNLLQTMADTYETELAFDVKPYIPEGEELAKHTFNPRIGVIGGISIIGTTGIVKPYSNEAFLASIRQQVKVAKGNQCSEIVLTAGKRSENRLKPGFPQLPAVAYIHFGNLVGETIKLSVEEGIEKINLAIMFGKSVKLAEGHMDTHSKNVVFNSEFVAGLAKDCGHNSDVVNQIKQLKLANAILDIIPFSEDEPFYQLVANKCHEKCNQLLSKSNSLCLFLLVGDNEMIKVESKN
ncbi:cobalt-precorrin-5B (C(1))-methyltransferase CbiD [Ancylomarina sp. 16SWW S1-10-2]|uniref:cobalt-precorrin-5B (C(1))-methyltransferase CbiD n=1 Tax=Ancylomarina sp. 16SWW S1-10-2 TaxID=2499681 RepID=UPI0012AE2DEE|nr:cobalt-precorrin-5B (C(1))-methyltransferase CbiD [Ancylomarina sp. 16SWW S1-10-2]MRT94624.1 cobalamin biosynthesis protein CbiD [Ancylomarina sp. 16SWW S1-10-2]